jgi:hypothetical protein
VEAFQKSCDAKLDSGRVRERVRERGKVTVETEVLLV